MLTEGKRPNDTLASRTGRQGVNATRLVVPRTVGSAVLVTGGVSMAPALPAAALVGTAVGAQRAVVGGIRSYTHAKDKMHTAAGHLRHEVVALRTDPSKVAQPPPKPTLRTRVVSAVIRKTPESRPVPGPAVRAPLGH